MDRRTGPEIADRVPGADPPSSSSARLVSWVVVVLGVAIAAVAIGSFVAAVTDEGGVVTVVVSDPDALDLALADAPVGTEVRLDAGGATRLGRSSIEAGLVVDQLPPALRVLAATPMLVAGIITVTGALVLRRLLIEIASGRPFAPSNPQRIGVLAGLALVAALIPGVIASGATVAVLDHLDVAGPDTPFGFTILEVSTGPLVVAAVLGVVAHVFRYGQRLVDDVAGLV